MVIEGPRAGGHLGFTLEQLSYYTQERYEDEIRGILDVVKSYGEKYERKIPVVVAGGIYSREDMMHALALGAGRRTDGHQICHHL